MTEQNIDNRAGLSEIARRVGTYSTFKAQTLRSVNDEANNILLDENEALRPANGAALVSPIRQWTSRTNDDIGIALTEATAIALDVLTFHQERINNEAYIRCALESDSITGLVAALNYTASPAVSAETYLAFEVEPDRDVTVDAWSQVQSVPLDGEPPQTFETVEKLRAKGVLNAVQPQPSSRSVTGISTSVVRVPASSRGLIAGADVFIGTEASAERGRIERVRKTAEFLELTLAKDVIPQHNVKIWPVRTVANSYGTGLPASIDAPETFVRWRSKTIRSIFLDRIVVDDEAVRVALRSSTSYRLSQISEIVTTTRGEGPLERSVSHIILNDIELPTFGPGDHAALLGEPASLLLTRPATELDASATLSVPDGVAGSFEIDQPVFVTDKDGSHLARVSMIDESANSVQIQPPLPRVFDFETTRIRGNVVRARHGERSSEETVGDGDPTLPTQDFEFKKSPLSWRLDGASSLGRTPEVQFFADGLQWSWTAQPSRASDDPRFVVRGAGDDQYVSIGEIANGRSAPRGKRNISATYRTGGGLQGKVGPNTLRTALDRPPAFRKVTNPLAAENGADAETAEHMRVAAPRSLRAFGRIISLDDFAQAALNFSGVAKAYATWTWANGVQVVHVTVAGDGGSALSDEQLDELRIFLDRQRDDRRPMSIDNYVSVPVEIQVEVTADSRVVVESFEASILRILERETDFDRLQFGRPLYASELTRALHDQPSVLGVRWKNFARRDDQTRRRLKRAGRASRFSIVRLAVSPDPMPLIGMRGATPAGSFSNRPAELPSVEIARTDLQIVLRSAPEALR